MVKMEFKKVDKVEDAYLEGYPSDVLLDTLHVSTYSSRSFKLGIAKVESKETWHIVCSGMSAVVNLRTSDFDKASRMAIEGLSDTLTAYQES